MSLNNRIFHGFLKSVDTTGKSPSFENLQTFVWPSAEPLHPYRKPLHSRDPLEVRPKYQTKYSTSSRFVCSCWVSFVEFHDLIQSLFHASVQGTAKEKWAGRKQYFISSARHFAPLFNIQTHETVGGDCYHAQRPTRLKLDRFFFHLHIHCMNFLFFLAIFKIPNVLLWIVRIFLKPHFSRSSRQYLSRSGY